MGAILAAIAALGLAVLIYVQSGEESSKFPPVVTASTGITAEINGRVAGNPDAKVQVVEWGDYQCPACTQFKNQVVPVLIDEYVNTGLITFEFRDFAFLGPESTRAAEAAACALDQDKFWDFHSTIYANHNGENQGALSDDRLISMAEKLGLDMDAFTTCFDDRTHEDDITASYEEGSAIGVNSTPTLVINGEIYRYAGLDDLRAKLDAALAA